MPQNKHKKTATLAPFIAGLVAIIVAIGLMIANIAGYTQLPLPVALMVLVAGLALNIVGLSLNAAAAKAKQDPPD